MTEPPMEQTPPRPRETFQTAYEQLYRDELSVSGPAAFTPWDIGGPQPVVRELVAHGALRGEILEPGTGPGHHAIYYASQGYSVTGVDASPAAIEKAKRNAEIAGVKADFRVADATKLDGFEDRFDTVVATAVYHVFRNDEDSQHRYMRALHRATKPGARLYMFEFGCQNINGLQWNGLAAATFTDVLPASGWSIDYLGPTTYQCRLAPDVFTRLADNPEWAKQMKPVREQIRVLGPLLEDHLVHAPFWAVHCTRKNK